MKCFYHAEVDAVGICKNCSRALCHECAIDVGDGLACKGRCEEKVKAVNALVDKNLLVTEKASTNYSLSALIYGVLGILFVGLGTQMTGMISLIEYAVGLVFIVMAGRLLMMRNSIFSKPK